MLRNYLKIAFRNLRRHPAYTFINIGGLAIGLAVCLLIGLLIRHELSYDRFHENADRIYRLLMGSGQDGQPRIPAQAAAYIAQFPEVETVVRMYPSREIVLREDKEPFREEDFFYADSTFFEVFSFPLIRGHPSQVLSQPNTVVLTRETARRYFGNENPIGQTLTLREGPMLRVTGVMENVPSNSHLQFDLLASFATLGVPRGMDYSSYSYFLLFDKQGASSLEAKPAELTSKSMHEIAGRLGFALKEMDFALQPLTDIHLIPAMGGAIPAQSDIQYLYIFGAIGFLILLIACINYVNLATARSARRAREVGMRKTFGAHRRQLAGQFLGESILSVALAFLLALGLSHLLLPVFNAAVGKNLSLQAIQDGGVIAALVGAVVLTGLLSGSYPALILSRFVPSRVLRGQVDRRGGEHRLRQGLVVVQFAVSVTLIIGTLVIHRQLDYIQSKRLGYETEQVLMLPMIEPAYKRLAAGPYEPNLQQISTFKRELRKVPGVQHVSVASSTPTTKAVSDVEYQGRTYRVAHLRVDHDYIETMDMELVAGRGFSPKRASDSARGIIVNETAARLFDLEDKVGEPIDMDLGYSDPILIGIVKDFHTASLHQPIRPTVLLIRPIFYNEYVLRLASGSLPDVLDRLERTWKQLAPNYPFRYQFLDEKLQAQYETEQRVAAISGAFSALAILIACLGLFGLAAFTVERRTKEIGIRKVLGATVPNIVALLSKDFLKLVGIAIVIATPIAYFAMNRWLQDFAYRIDLGVGVFLLAGLIAVIIAFLTVSYQSIKAALANPADSLRYE